MSEYNSEFTGGQVDEAVRKVLNGEVGGSGKDGGYYTPIVNQTSATTMRVSFEGSQAGMPAVAPVDVTLPAGVSATHSWNGTVLTVTSASGASSANLKGEKGDTPVKGEDYFTEADKTEIVSEVLALVPSGDGSSAADNMTSLGDTPLTLTKSGSVRLVCASECAYSAATDTVAVADILNGTPTKVTVKEVDGHYQIQGDGTAAAFYNQFLTIPITGLVVGEEYNFIFDAEGMDWNPDSYITVGHWILKDGNGETLATKGITACVKHVHAFTATTTNLSLVWYPIANSYFAAGEKHIANVRGIGVNRAGTTELTDVVALEGTFTGSTTLGTLPVGTTISAAPAATVYLVVSNTSGEYAKALADKTVVCFGDSLFGMYRGEDSTPAVMAKYTGATVHNVGFGGCRMAVHPTSGYGAFSMWALAKAIAENDWTDQDAQASSGSAYFPEQLALLKSIDFNEVDIAVIHYGTNDFASGNGIPIDNASDPDDYNSLCGALRYSIEKLLGVYPKLRIYVSLPVYRFWTDSGVTTYAETYLNKIGKTLPEFVEALRGVAAEYNLPVIDGYYGLGINKINASTFMSDGTHHNVAGRERFGRFIGANLTAQQNTAKSGTDMAAVQTMIDNAIGTAIGGAY